MSSGRRAKAPPCRTRAGQRAERSNSARVFRQFDFHARARPSLYLLDIGRKIRPLTAEELKVLGPRYPYIPPQIDYGSHRPDAPADLVLPEGDNNELYYTC